MSVIADCSLKALFDLPSRHLHKSDIVVLIVELSRSI